MRISIVTISFNQGMYLEQAIESVLMQDYPDVEYIVVDAGSTDGSRDIIDRYADKIDKVIFEPDEGPPDGLNKGLSLATGQIYGFLNADDYLLPDALMHVAAGFRSKPDKDVLSGHALVVSKRGATVRRFYSRRFSCLFGVHGATTLAQQATFFRKEIFESAGGFNKREMRFWDGELWFDMAMAGAKFGIINEFLGAFRLYPGTVSMETHNVKQLLVFQSRMFKKCLGRERRPAIDNPVKWVLKGCEYLMDLRILRERILKGHANALPPSIESNNDI